MHRLLWTVLLVAAPAAIRAAETAEQSADEAALLRAFERANSGYENGDPEALAEAAQWVCETPPLGVFVERSAYDSMEAVPTDSPSASMKAVSLYERWSNDALEMARLQGERRLAKRLQKQSCDVLVDKGSVGGTTVYSYATVSGDDADNYQTAFEGEEHAEVSVACPTACTLMLTVYYLDLTPLSSGSGDYAVLMQVSGSSTKHQVSWNPGAAEPVDYLIQIANLSDAPAAYLLKTN